MAATVINEHMADAFYCTFLGKSLIQMELLDTSRWWATRAQHICCS